MKYYGGIDIGSTSIKLVLIDQEKRLVADVTSPTGSHFHQNTMKAFVGLLADNGMRREDVAYIFSTGYGRKLFKESDETISEITANAVGATAFSREGEPVRTIINIGGQDLKVIQLDGEGQIHNFAMNDKCAAGTGRFLEMTARNLEVEVDQLGDLHMRATGVPLTINSTCTVFAESEIISLLANGHGKEELIAGVHYSIAKRVARLAKRFAGSGAVFFDGGPARNRGLVAALEDELMRPVIVPSAPQITTAFGAALLALEACEDLAGEGSV
ncbi:acyl-CoA dehydratase activase [Desulfurivibrio dismutans]|uniref:acyl-CoA dehydratase activase n=1 Tax=Desulfurivibrio dismutans TaxID=1398908 RepID=UPI0023D9F9C6|nr:acyl-CoA dehydratase activase [Desulfurivibrio alkaliphilus]MDF1615061.1 acyl-CoA dehydratase activase [Desulfurivibrio alkaliphilus]